jgi:hypothetical protein
VKIFATTAAVLALAGAAWAAESNEITVKASGLK